MVQKARSLGLPDTFYNYLLLSDNSEDSETFPWERNEEEEENEGKGADETEDRQEETEEEQPDVKPDKNGIPKPQFGQAFSGSFNFGTKSTG